MSGNGQHDTLRRVVTSAAILGGALVLFDGGRGLTGRAGGGAVGCGGYDEVAQEERGVGGGYRVSPAVAAIDAMIPVLELGAPQVSFRTAPRKPTPPLAGPPNPAPRPAPLPGNAPVNAPAPRPGPDLFVALADAGAGRFAIDLRGSRLASVLSNPYRRFTVFAPSDGAWEKLRETRPELFEAKNAVLLEEVLGQHVIAREIRAAALGPAELPALMPGSSLEIGGQGPGASVGTRSGSEAQVDPSVEVLARNGVVLIVDEALVPPFTAWAHIRNEGHNLFASAIEATQQVDRFSDLARSFTVLVPTDDAFRVAGWDTNRLHDPGFRAEVSTLVDAHVIEQGIDVSALAQGAYPAADGELVKVFSDPSQAPMIERPASGVTTSFAASDLATDHGYVHALEAVLVN